MTHQDDDFNLGEIVFHDNNQERKCWANLAETCSRSLIVFLSQLFVIFWSSVVAFGEFTFQKFVTNQLFELQFCVVRQDTSYPHQDYEQVNFLKKSSFYSLVGPSKTGKWQPIYNWLKIGTFQPKFDKIFFIELSQHLYDVMQKENENLVFVRGVNYGFIDSLRKNGTKHLLYFDDSCEEICNPKVFVDLATGRYRGVGTIYINHNLFHQSKLG